MPRPDQHAAALTPDLRAVARRQQQARRFDTLDETMLLQAAIGVLQDLGYTIQESQQAYGIVVGSRATPFPVRVQVVVQAAAASGRGVLARASFQRVARGYAAGEMLDDPALYQRFFEALSQSAFLTAHEI
ncbi:hypothetical protein ACLF3G_06060 [Falsiroseomonas sp. HC035]|uniref:hypothetical protein n=1 Tax=Falsiroseomonas sp. HC035 TaxID=3390999 RepID=UPI003D30FA79